MMKPHDPRRTCRRGPAGVSTLALSLLLATSCATAPAARTAPAPATLAARIDAILDAGTLARASWGVLIRDAGSGSVIYARNPDRHFIPASNTKLVVSIVSLGVLGPDWRYRTEVRAAAPDSAGTVAELRVIGSGDPTLSERFWEGEHAAIAALADSIAAAGVRRVAGPVVIDASRFADPQVNSSWEVGDLPATYAAPISAFGIEEGTFALEVQGAANAGAAALLAPLLPAGGNAAAPQPMRAHIVTDTAGAPTRVRSDYTARYDTLYLTGSVAAGNTDTVRLAVIDPPLFAGRVLARALAARGVSVDSVVVQRTAAPAPGTGVLIAALTSAPLAEIVAAILQPSQNWIAEHVLKTLGAERGRAGTWSEGIAVERRYLANDVAIDTLAFNLRDGSGLSAQNLLTPAATVQLLEHARHAPWSTQFRSALAAPGLEGSTLENRLAALAGRLFAKTGTIANVNALSGYLTANSGRELTFSILSNGSGLPAATVRAATDSVLVMVAREVK